MKKLDSDKSKAVFFLGADEDTLNLVKNKLNVDFPNIHRVETYSPPFVSEFSENEIKKISKAISKFKPDALWVGITAPKQEKLIEQLKIQTDFKWAFAVGAVFDYYSGKIKRPPLWVRKLGLEWLSRLIQQPKKISQRVFLSNFLFIVFCFKLKFQNRKLIHVKCRESNHT